MADAPDDGTTAETIHVDGVAMVQLLGPQDGLVEPVAADAAVQHLPAGHPLEGGRPRFAVRHLVAESE